MTASDIVALIGVTILLLVVVWSFWYERWVTRQKPPAGGFVSTPFGQLHVIARGKPSETGLRPIVMIHGSTTNALDMDLEMAKRFDGERLVLMPDRPGHGFSDRPKDGYRLDVQAAMIKAGLDALGVEKPIIFGQSYGGAVALRYALDFPDDVSGLVLIAAVAYRWPGGVAWYNRVAINPIYGWFFRRTFIALYGRFGSPRGVERAMRGSAFASGYHIKSRVPLTFRPSRFQHNAEDITRLYEQLCGMDTKYNRIAVPAELVAGTHDMTVITSVHSRALDEAMQNTHLQIVSGAGHALHHTHPDAAEAAVRRLDLRLASADRSPLQGALRRMRSVFPRAAD